MSYLSNQTYVPTNPGSYPGQGEPSPVIGQANRTAITPGPEFGRANRTAITTSSIEAQPHSASTASIHQPEIAQAVHTTTPVSTPIGQAAHTPLITPLGTSPQFETPTQQWSWVTGNGGVGGHDGGA